MLPSLRRVHRGLIEARRRPVLSSRPLCDICGKYLDSEELVETWATGARVLGRHHGSEELASFELGRFDWDEDDLAGAMRAHRWFLPEARNELTERPVNREPDMVETLTFPRALIRERARRGG